MGVVWARVWRDWCNWSCTSVIPTPGTPKCITSGYHTGRDEGGVYLQVVRSGEVSHHRHDRVLVEDSIKGPHSDEVMKAVECRVYTHLMASANYT